jgi:hypothetical protein
MGDENTGAPSSWDKWVAELKAVEQLKRQPSRQDYVRESRENCVRATLEQARKNVRHRAAPAPAQFATPSRSRTTRVCSTRRMSRPTRRIAMIRSVPSRCVVVRAASARYTGRISNQ